MSVRLPSRYEDLDEAFKGRLRPNVDLLDLVKKAFVSMEINGGIRFLPIFGESGVGKSSASLEVGTHLPGLHVEKLPREAIEKPYELVKIIEIIRNNNSGKKLVAVIDQYEEVSAQKTAIPSEFVETISLLDRGQFKDYQILFIWLTTSKQFQADLAKATTRNKRILVSADYELPGLPNNDWTLAIQENFRFHNHDRDLSDYQVIDLDIIKISNEEKTIGDAIGVVGERLTQYASQLHDLSDYQVVMLWPVTDGLRITRIQQFTDPRQGYKLDWNAWYRQLNTTDQQQLPLREYNRARLYFDVRLVPVAAADLHPLCKDLDKDVVLGKSYLQQLKSTHFYSVLAGSWNSDSYAPLRERISKRADDARVWYEGVTREPTLLGKRISKCLSELGINADYEKPVRSVYREVRADILVDRTPVAPKNVIIEIKAFSPENTMPSSICAAVQTTLKRHAQFAGFLQRQ